MTSIILFLRLPFYWPKKATQPEFQRAGVETAVTSTSVREQWHSLVQRGHYCYRPLKTVLGRSRVCKAVINLEF